MAGRQQIVSGAFRALARWRGAPAVHPRGMVFAGRVAVTERDSAAAAALGGTGERPALVRVSKATATPGALPDLLGIAVRAEVGGHLLDVLFTSTGRSLLAPSTGWCRRPYSTLMPYSAEGHRVVLGLDPDEPERAGGTDLRSVAHAVAAAPLTFTLTERERRGSRRAIGRLVLERVNTDEELAFDPVLNAHPRLHPAPPLRRLREWAYRGSRRGRRADPGALRRLP